MSSQVDAVIFDLDGTLIQTETLVLDVASKVVESHGKVLTDTAIHASLGKRPLDAWATVIDMVGISNATAQELFDASEPMLTERWHEATYLPGAQRLIRHLTNITTRLGLATSTSRAVLHRKLQNKHDLQTAFDAVCCGDDPGIVNGKPAPDSFLSVSKELNVPPSRCLVIEDSPSGVEAALRAGMLVVYVPSVPSIHRQGVDGVIHGREKDEGGTLTMSNEQGTSGRIAQVLKSLLDFDPTRYGLPPFNDYVDKSIPLDTVFKIKGTVVKGFGRGSKDLGIPTANVDHLSISKVLADSVTGIFLGWAAVGDQVTAVFPMCCSIGWNPFFNNTTKTCEPWILHDFGSASFVGDTIRLIICGYIRPEADFTSLEALIEKIHEDAAITMKALENSHTYQSYKSDPFFFTTKG